MTRNREFLQLCEYFDPKRDEVFGWYVSEKFDGMRALWDGGITRGHVASDVPWGTEPHRLSTGLWSRYGKVISAPDWWLNELPNGVILDGELFKGYGRFQETISACKKHEPLDAEWADVWYKVFDTPSLLQLMTTGRINNANMKVELDYDMPVLGSGNLVTPSAALTFNQVVATMPKDNDIISVVQQTKLPFTAKELDRVIEEKFDEVTAHGGEGLVIRKPTGMWKPYRTREVLKLKQSDNETGTVTGWVEGTGEDAGLLGSLYLKWRGGEFKLSGTGIRDDLRMLDKNDKGELWPKDFPEGTRVNFTFSGFTNDGKPRIARFSGVVK